MPIEIVIQLITVIATVLGVLIAGYAVLSYTKGGRLKFGGGRGLEAEIEEARHRLTVSPTGGETTDKQYLLLKEYHAQGLAQSKISFWFSLIFASLGFLVIITAIFTMEPGASIGNQGRTLITLIAGTIIDAVSALFFVQSNKARQLMVDFFDRLRNDRKLDESLRLATGISDSVLQNRLHTLLALNFADIKPNDIFLASVLGIGTQTINQPAPHIGQNTSAEGGQSAA